MILSPQSQTLDTTSLENLIPQVFENGITFDLGDLTFVTPWGVVGLCAVLTEMKGRGLAFEVVEPRNSDVLCYLKRVRFDEFAKELGILDSHFKLVAGVSLQEHPAMDRLIELTRLNTRPDFQAREGQLADILQRIGMGEDQAYLAVAVIAEVVDNIFVHNFGRWPFVHIPGGLVMAQKFGKVNTIKIAVGDLGVGIRKTLTDIEKYKSITSDEEAIRKALEPDVTSRPQQRGGNGLPFILKEIQGDFRGQLDIRSGDCHIQSSGGIKCRFKGKQLIGTMIGLTINY